MEKTLSIIKPDGVDQNIIGKIIQKFEDVNLEIVALKMIKLSKEEAEGFYIVHKGKPFYDSLTDFMSEGPIVPMVIHGSNSISRVREIMGATDPKKADEGTIRFDFAESMSRNIVHGSDSLESANFEISYFFSDIEICN